MEARSHHKLPDEVVESGPQVVEELSDADAPSRVGVLADLAESHDHPLALDVGLIGDPIRLTLDVGLYLRLKFVKVSLGPFELEAGADE